MLRFIRDFSFRNLFLSVLLAGIFFLPQNSLSRDGQVSPAVISEVIVKVDDVEEQDVRDMILLREGEPFSLRRINEIVKYLYRIGAFSDVKVVRDGEEKVQLTFLLQRKLFTRSISFTGDRRLPKRILRGSLYSLQEYTPFSERGMGKAKEELAKSLQEEGYLRSEVKASYKNTQPSSVNVVFDISLGDRFTIRKIDFVGEVLLPLEKLRRRMKNREGAVYIPSRIEEDIQRLKELYKSLGYQRAEVKVQDRRFEESGIGLFLTIAVNPHEKIEIQVRGSNIPLDLLRPLWEEGVFEEWSLQEGESRIIAYLRKRGHLFATATFSIQRAENVITVLYGVNPGEVYKVEDIDFKGLSYFSPAELEQQLELQRKIPFVKWVGGERIFELTREIERVYRTHGFPQTKVDFNFEKRGKSVKAVFFIEEGRQEKIDSIEIEGASFVSPEALLEQIDSRADGPFYQPDVYRDVEKLEYFYLNQGHRGAEVQLRFEERMDNLVSIRFTVNEGRRVKIEKIVITGNTSTKKKTILKELRIQEGDYAYLDKIQETKRRLEALGTFSEISIEEVSLSPESSNLVISVREGQRNYAGLGLGLETKNEPYSLAFWNNALRPRGTVEYIRSNVFGTASQFSAVGQLSLKEQRVVVSYEQPYLFGLPWESYLNAWIEVEDRPSFNYDRRGVSLTGIKNVSKTLVLLATVRWARTTLYDLQIAESEIDRQHSPFSATSVSGSFIWDRRDDPFNPKRGIFLSLVSEWAYPLFGAESDYLKNFLKFQHFASILPGFVFSSTFRLGLGTGKIPIHERFFAGGSNSFRGEKYDELGPKDPQSNMPLGGKALLLFNFEMRFPLHPALRDLSGAFFYDVGNVFPEMSSISLSSFSNALGMGVRYKTPLGPVRLDFGLSLGTPQRKSKIYVYVTIGNVF